MGDSGVKIWVCHCLAGDLGQFPMKLQCVTVSPSQGLRSGNKVTQGSVQLRVGPTAQLTTVSSHLLLDTLQT